MLRVCRSGKHELRVVWTPGHTAGHICLHDAERGLVLTGDHVLDPITPSVNYMRPNLGNPLGSFLASLVKIRELDADFVLPAHGEPFHGLRRRVDEILRHHDEREAAALDSLAGGALSAAHVAEQLPWTRRKLRLSELPPFQQRPGARRNDCAPRGAARHWTSRLERGKRLHLLRTGGACGLIHAVHRRPGAGSGLTMRALQVTDLSGPDGVRVTDVPELSDDVEGVLLDVRAVGLSFPDLLRSQGLYQERLTPPYTLGSEVAGVVLRAPASTGFQRGTAWQGPSPAPRPSARSPMRVT